MISRVSLKNRRAREMRKIRLSKQPGDIEKMKYMKPNVGASEVDERIVVE
jgi:hypothetical protein